MSVFTEEAQDGARTISLETGHWAKQAHGSVVYRCGDLTLLATVCAEKEAREGQDFFPLTVDYRERYYAAGRIPGGYFKRETRPAEHETLLSRMIDRPIRPLFPTGYFSEVQLLVSVLSYDSGTSIEGHAITAASAALMVSDIPFQGPIAGVVIGKVDGEFVVDPGEQERKKSDLDLIVAGSRAALTMIEGGASEYTNEQMLEALEFAHKAIQKKLDLQEQIAKKANVTKRELALRLPDPALMKEVREFAFEKLKVANRSSDKAERGNQISEVNKATLVHFEQVLTERGAAKIEQSLKDIKNELHELEFEVVRGLLFEEGIRADGRRPDEIRDIAVEVDVLPGAHGSSVFTRGQTQALGVVTLGTASDNQRYETLAGQDVKNFMLHYNFPPYSVGEVKRMMGPGRREIGHGHLAYRALKYVFPQEASSFPYVVRVVAEILESNGSSSMATVCSGSLAMMCAGVPLNGSVSGIAMGLMTGETPDQFVILSDIAGIEDHFGDMDFKVAGTAKGITAFQLDLKLKGISIDLLRQALTQAEKGRLHILSKMDAVLNESRPSTPANAPQITQIQIDSDRIGELIGPGGRIIRAIIEQSGADISVEDDGKVSISSLNMESNQKAQKLIEDIFREVEEGEAYEGTVRRIADFGAFVELFPGKEGLLHISKMSTERVSSVSDHFKEGDRVPVVVAGVDRMGRIDLIHADVHKAGGPVGSNGRGGDRDRGRGGDRDRGRGGDRDRGRSGGGRPRR